MKLRQYLLGVHFFKYDVHNALHFHYTLLIVRMEDYMALKSVLFLACFLFF